MDNVRHIGVIGAGLMGHGIALTLARAGHTVRVTDPVADARASVAERVAASMTAMGLGEDEIAQTLPRIAVAETTAAAGSPWAASTPGSPTPMPSSPIRSPALRPTCSPATRASTSMSKVSGPRRPPPRSR